MGRSNGKCFSEKERDKFCKDYIKRIINEEMIGIIM